MCIRDRDYTINILPGLIFEEENNFSLNIYPNPSDGIYQLEYINAVNGGINIDVFDITGNKIVANTITQEEGVINLDITNVAPGLYFIKATLSNGETVIKEIIKN